MLENLLFKAHASEQITEPQHLVELLSTDKLFLCLCVIIRSCDNFHTILNSNKKKQLQQIGLYNE
ncbi:MAG: hypothetical protein CK430_10625 [Legionella sp.]|nr:MAG: hypothetical protein CK430_10625 [Legionella sp.]